uniref:Uncharacterized protein n=1 Tax=Anopheles quadriannulatus TaxID=34691 RepID=A0A182XSG7_ANOQN
MHRAVCSKSHPLPCRQYRRRQGRVALCRRPLGQPALRLARDHRAPPAAACVCRI